MSILGKITNEPLRVLMDRMYELIDNQPEVLLETAGGPLHRSADIVIARLYGPDDQIEHEWRIDRAVTDLLTPIPLGMAAILRADDEATPFMRTARYTLQSNYAAGTIAYECVTDLVSEWKPQIAVLCLRYRRVLS